MNKYIIGMMATAILTTACTDQWDDHYAVEEGAEESLWEALQQQDELSNFVRVIEATGYNARLDGSQMFTIFAPTDECLTDAEADELINRFSTEKKQGVREENNSVVRQFVQNHISLFNHSVSEMTDQTVTLMNGKYERITGKTIGESNFLTKNKFYANGVLYTIDEPISYFANVYEYLELNGKTDSLFNFLDLYSRYEFDADRSVPGDIVDGKTVYLDSVFRLTNTMLSSYGHINREDSSYLMLAPTDQVWKQLYDEYLNYFNYLTSKRDSMVRIQTRRAIADGTVFNLNAQRSMADSVVSTAWQRLYEGLSVYTEPRYYAYFRPYEADGAFFGAEETECSNGTVLTQDDWKIDKRSTFYKQIKIEAEASRYIDTIIQARDPLSVRAVPQENPFYGKVSENYFVEAQPLSTASSTSVRYAIPDQLSNIGYDIIAVFAPAIAYNENALAEDRLPCRVRFTISYLEQDGSKKEATLRSPIDNSVNFVTTPDVMDSVLVASDYKFPTCALGIDEPQVTLRVASNITSSQSSKYTRTLRLDCIILRPHVEN